MSVVRSPVRSVVRSPVRSVFGLGVGGVLATIGARLEAGRVDFVGIGDSNQIFGGLGWDHGFQYALSQTYSMYATGLIAFAENGFSGSAAGYLYGRAGSSSNGTLTFATSGAPSAQDVFLNKGTGTLTPYNYAYAATGETANTYNSGLILSAGCPLDPSAALECDFYYGTFDTGSGAFNPAARYGVSPFTFIATQAVSTNTGVLGGMSKSTLAISADGARTAVQFSYNRIGTNTVTAPVFFTYLRARRPSVTAGFSYSTLDFRGGQGARTMAVDLQQAADATLTHFFSILRADQGTTKTVCVVINSGLNDRNETLTSVGPAAVADADSPEAFVDNLQAIVERVEEIWSDNGWSRSELFFLFMPSHPVSDPDDTELSSYRTATAAYAPTVTNGALLNIEALYPQASIQYASSGTDKNHLTQTDYELISVALVAEFA
jgi:hypothetical protein